MCIRDRCWTFLRVAPLQWLFWPIWNERLWNLYLSCATQQTKIFSISHDFFSAQIKLTARPIPEYLSRIIIIDGRAEVHDPRLCRINTLNVLAPTEQETSLTACRNTVCHRFKLKSLVVLTFLAVLLKFQIKFTYVNLQIILTVILLYFSFRRSMKRLVTVASASTIFPSTEILESL